MAKWKKMRLLEASALGRKDVVKRFLNSGVNPNVSNSHGITPLMIAARINNLDIIHMLIENGANIESKDRIGRSAFSYALKHGNKQALLALIDAYAKC